MIKLDMWYGDDYREADNVDVNFCPQLNCTYRGNIYQNGNIVGDYIADSQQEVEKIFNHLEFKEKI